MLHMTRKWNWKCFDHQRSHKIKLIDWIFLLTPRITYFVQGKRQVLYANFCEFDCRNSIKETQLIGNTIHTRQNRVKVSNPSHLTAERLSLPEITENEDRLKTFEGENVNWETRNKSIYLKLNNLIQPCVLTFVEEMEGTFDRFTTLLPQSVLEMFQRKSLRLRKYQERLESYARGRRIAIARCENERRSPLAHSSVQTETGGAWLLSRSASLPTSSHHAV